MQTTVTKEKPITKDSYIFTVTAAARILGIDKYSIESVRFSEILNKFIVQFEDSDPLLGGQQKFLTKQNFYRDFANSRRERRHQILVKRTNQPLTFSATSSKDMMASRYVLELTPSTITCNCKDQEVQRNLKLPQQCCKHSYALMELLGMQTLSLIAYRKDKVYQNIVDNLEF